MHVLILGAGAEGGCIGARRLLAVSADVVFLARGRRLAKLSDRGLVIHCPLGAFAAPVKAASAPPAGFAPELAIIARKAPALDGALQSISRSIGEKTCILPFLNGIAHFDTVQRTFSSAPLLGGIAHGALTLRHDGAFDHLPVGLAVSSCPSLGLR